MWNWQTIIPFYLWKAKATETAVQEQKKQMAAAVKSKAPLLIIAAAITVLIYKWK